MCCVCVAHTRFVVPKYIHVQCTCVYMHVSLIPPHIPPLPRPQVTDVFNATLPCQIGPVWEDKGKMASGEFELVFAASLPPLSLSQFRLMAGSELSARARVRVINIGAPRE